MPRQGRAVAWRRILRRLSRGASMLRLRRGLNPPNASEAATSGQTDGHGGIKMRSRNMTDGIGHRHYSRTEGQGRRLHFHIHRTSAETYRWLTLSSFVVHVRVLRCPSLELVAAVKPKSVDDIASRRIQRRLARAHHNLNVWNFAYRIGARSSGARGRLPPRGPAHTP
jgi:hypothetical protein